MDGEYKEKREEKKRSTTTGEKKGKRKGDEKDPEPENPTGETTTDNNDEEKTFQKAGKRRKDLTDMEKWIQDREENKWTSFPDYEERAKEINRSILKEERDRNSRIERARKEEKSWELIRLCTKFFDEYC